MGVPTVPLAGQKVRPLSTLPTTESSREGSMRKDPSSSQEIRTLTGGLCFSGDNDKKRRPGGQEAPGSPLLATDSRSGHPEEEISILLKY